METLISSLFPQHVFPITHASDVAAARRAGQKLADLLGFDDVKAGRLAIIITEAGSNILKHAGEGTLYVMRSQSVVAMPGVDVVAIDNGPGIGDLGLSIQDGISTAGTAGTGLGALRRQSDEFDVWTQRDRGAAFFMRVWQGEKPVEYGAIEIGALITPLAGEEESGDGWAVSCDAGGATLLGVDGLGHGPEAAKAARGAIEALMAHPDADPAGVIDAAHQALRVTRGAALSVARIGGAAHGEGQGAGQGEGQGAGQSEGHGAGVLRFAGIGNVSGTVDDGVARRTLVSHNGIVGHNMRKVQEFRVDCPPGTLCILHSDGIQTQWDLAAYPGLQERMPVLVAALLMRDFIRRRDDAMVLVARSRYQP